MCASDRIGVISKGELLLVEDKTTVMHKFGKRKLGEWYAEPDWAEALKAQQFRG